MTAEVEVQQEVEAMEAVYGSDCTVFQVFPPHLSIFIKPRTADDASVQFVEAVLVMEAGEKYPDAPPELELKDVKGLGDSRHAQLLGDLRAQAAELAGGPMLVAISEAATDLLTNMNTPDGDCCFCTDPLDDGAKPFMKLMACFHCFHSDCFGDWWRWLQYQQPTRPPLHAGRLQDEDGEETSLEQIESSEGRITRAPGELQMHCPVCRKLILAEDFAHVHDYLLKENGMKPFFLQYEDTKVPVDILTDAELVRRAQFSAQFEAQLERGGIIENKRLEVIQPGMIVPPRTPPLVESTPEEVLLEDQGTIAPSDVPPRETSTTQGRSRMDGQTGHSHVHQTSAGRDGFGGGRAHRGYHSGGRSHRGRQGGGFRGNRGYRGRSGVWRDMGTSGTSRMQSQDVRQVERTEVEPTREHSQANTQLDRGESETAGTGCRV
ncbi:unnamed protein product [Calypogeia fissa]